MRYLRETYPNVMVSVEMEKPTEEGMEALVPEADIVFYSWLWAEVRFVLFGLSY